MFCFIEFHELDSSAGVVQAVGEVVRDLQALVKVSAISDDDLVTLALISDLSYAWNLIEDYTQVMQVRTFWFLNVYNAYSIVGMLY